MSEKNLTDREFVEKYDSYKKNDGCFFVISKLLSLSLIVKLLFLGFVSFLAISNMGKNMVKDIAGYLYVCSIAIVLILPIIMDIRDGWKKQKEQKKELGMSEKQASRRYLSIIQNPIYGELYPIVQKMCRLNPDAQSSQEEQINGWFTSEGYDEHFGVMYDKKFDFNMTYRDADFDLAIQILNKGPMSYRQFFVDKLFKLAVVDDGIHNDEWNLLMDIMKQLKFNKNYFDFFIKRYGPLRTEFEADEQGEKQSTKSIPVSQLKAYFAILGLEEGASDVEIKRAYHNLALQHHPDLPKNAGRVRECEELMARINEAYEKIRN